MRDRSIGKLLMLLIVAVVFGSFLVTPSATAVSKSLVTSSSATIYVPEDYAKIQWAENAANAGDTIVVRDGTYSEKIKVNKRLTIKSKSGPDKTIVRAANSTDYVFEIIADHVNISGFTIDGGIFLNRSSNNSITNNIFTSDGRGIFLWASSCDNIITNNSFSNNEIIITISSNNSVINNIFENGGIGIYEYGSIEHVTSQTIENNTVNGKPIYYYKNIKGIKVPEDAGQVMIANCSNMIIRNINASSTSNGILLAYTKNSIIDNNTCLNNRNSAIFLSQSVNNSITNNNCSRNGFAAIRLSHSIGNSNTNNNC
jgi:parallel beta-helix repeat protein